MITHSSRWDPFVPDAAETHQLLNLHDSQGLTWSLGVQFLQQVQAAVLAAKEGCDDECRDPFVPGAEETKITRALLSAAARQASQRIVLHAWPWLGAEHISPAAAARMVQQHYSTNVATALEGVLAASATIACRPCFCPASAGVLTRFTACR